MPKGSGPRIAVLLAAGASRRFGPENKLLHVWGGQPLVWHAASTLCRLGLDQTWAIVSSDAVARVLPTGMRPHRIAPGQDMATSFRAAIMLAREAGARDLLIALGDMPRVPVAVCDALMALPGSGAAECEGRPMPPIRLTSADFAAALAEVSGDEGARRFIGRLPKAALVALTRAEAFDIDTRENAICRAP